LYDLDLARGQSKLKNKKCPRCGTFMAHHKNPIERWTCGKEELNLTAFVHAF
jgi:small subunit ribosomal protein S27Ae